MNRIRIGLVGLVVLALTGLTAGGATAATGRGTAAAGITLLDIALGDVQQLKVLTNESRSTLDGTPGAFGQLVAVDAAGALNLALPNPPFRASAPGSSNANLEPLDVAFPPAGVTVAGTGLPIGAGLLAAGVIDPVKVEAALDGAGARAAVGTEIPNLSVLQGLVSVNDVKVGALASDANPAASQADTGVVSVGDVSVLDLDAFLGGLGLSLDDLGLAAVTGLVDSLGLPVSTDALGLGELDVASISGILGSVFTLTDAIDTVVPGITDCSGLDTLNTLLAPVDDLLGTGGLLEALSLDSLLGGGGLLGGLLGGCTAGNLESTKTDIIGELQSTLTGIAPTADGVLESVLSTLSGAPLLQVSGVELSALAKAAETLAASSATTSAKLGTIKVGGLDVGALDLGATVEQVSALVNSVESTLSSVTSVLGLGNLLDVGILERVASTKTEGAYHVADAGVNVLRVSINPPAALSTVLQTAGALTDPLSGIIGTLGTAVPTAGLADNTVASAFGLTTLLSQPTTVVLGAIRAQGDFTIAAPGGTGGPVSTPVSGELPRTGSTGGAWMAALAALSLAGAFGITRSLRRANPGDIEG